MSKYSVTYSGIDGQFTEKFRSLKAAIKFVKELYEDDARRVGNNELHDDYGIFTFNGFTWKDVLPGEVSEKQEGYCDDTPWDYGIRRY